MYTRYTGYKCADCDFVASTTEEMDAHITKKHKNAKKIPDYVGKCFILESSETKIEYVKVHFFKPVEGVFHVTRYELEVCKGDIAKYSITEYVPLETVLTYDKEITAIFIDAKIKALAEKAYDNCKDDFITFMVKDCEKFINNGRM